MEEASSKNKFGTPAYLAPEIYNQKGDSIKYDTRVDIFALGIILY